MADSHSDPAPAHVAPPHSHGAHDDAAHVAAHVRKYLWVGGILLLFTVGTVGLAYVDFHNRHVNFMVAMAVATFKAGLVAAIFMHLKGEKKIIWRFLFFTVFFVLGLFFLTLLHEVDPIQGRAKSASEQGTWYNAH